MKLRVRTWFFVFMATFFSVNIYASGTVIPGGENDDLIQIGPGDYEIYADGGVDTIVLPFFPDGYVFSSIDENTYTAHYHGYTSRFYDVEYLRFGVDFLTTLPLVNMLSGEIQDRVIKLTDLYLAFFGRAPDVIGLEYWQKRLLEEGRDFATISKDFSWSEEAKELFPQDGLNNEDFVTIVYLNCFGRAPDGPGGEYWIDRFNALDPGDPEYLNQRGSLVGELLLGAYAETSGPEDRALLMNKHAVALYYVNQLSIHPEEVFDFAINDLLAMVSGDPATRYNAENVITYVLNNAVTLTDVMNSDPLPASLWTHDAVYDTDDDGDGWSEVQGDCDDSHTEIFPGATEICGDGIDQDCNGVDQSCPQIDNDGDGWTVSQGDCDDAAFDIHPGAVEICSDAIDQDCDGIDPVCANAEQWLGGYGSSLLEETAFYADLVRTDTTIRGAFRDAAGRKGALNGTIAGNTVTLQITETTPGCSGTFTGSGVIDQTTVLGTYTVSFNFSGSDCLGTHTGGEGLLVLQKSTVLVWGQQGASGLSYANGKLYWSQNDLDALKELDVATGNINVLATRMRSIGTLTYDGRHLLWTDRAGDYVPGGCTGIGVARDLLIAEPDGSNVRKLASAGFCGDLGPSSELLSDGTYAYWVRDLGYEKFIDRVPLAGGAVEQLATPGNGLRGIALDAEHFYWGEVVPLESTKIFRCPLDGCGQSGPETVLNDNTIEMWSANFALSGDKIILGIHRSGQLGYEVAVVPKEGGTVTDLAHSSEQILRVKADADTVVWLSSNALRSVELSGGEATTLTEELYYLQDFYIGPDRVYWTDASFQGGFPDTIYFKGKAGGEMNVLVSDLASPTFLAGAADGAIFYADSGPSTYEPSGISRVDPYGTITPIIVGVDGSTRLAADDNYVYTVQGFNIKRISRQNPQAELLCATNFYVDGMDTDGAALYWLEGPVSSVFRAPANPGEPSQFIASGQGLAVDLKVRGGYAYWLDSYDTLYRAPISGGPAEILDDQLSFATNLVVDDQYVYLIEADSRRITKLPLAGGTKTSIAGTNPYFGWYAMTQDTNNIYWADAAGLYRVAKNGQDQSEYTVPVLQDQFATPASIAVDDQYLYWTENMTGAIKREPK